MTTRRREILWLVGSGAVTVWMVVIGEAVGAAFWAAVTGISLDRLVRLSSESDGHPVNVYIQNVHAEPEQ